MAARTHAFGQHHGVPIVPLAVALVIGAGFSTQAFVNGRLQQSVGSPEMAGAVNNLVGLVLIAAWAVATGAYRRAWARMRRGPRPALWHLIVGANGGLVVIVGAEAAPIVGVALLTVAAVCGQLIGGLVVDRIGLSPAGRKGLSPTRLLGVVLAMGAVVLGATQSEGHLRVGLLALAMVAGAVIAAQQAAMGHVNARTGEPLVAATTNLLPGAVTALAAWVVVDGATAPGGWSAPPLEWFAGGLVAVVILSATAKIVAQLGILRLMLAIVAGQSVAALVFDLVAPAGAPVTWRTVLSIGLNFVAVAVTTLRRRPVQPPAEQRAVA